LDLVTKHPGQNVQRCIGNVAFELVGNPLADDIKKMMGGESPMVVGFENHGGRTYFGMCRPWGRC